MAKYTNYKSNLDVLKRAPEQDLDNEFVQSGIIDKFCLQFELAWKLLQETLRYEGRLDAVVGSPRGILGAAYSTYDFIEEDLWLEMLKDRNTSEHVYDSELAKRLVNDIIVRYIPAFNELLNSLESHYEVQLLSSF